MLFFLFLISCFIVGTFISLPHSLSYSSFLPFCQVFSFPFSFFPLFSLSLNITMSPSFVILIFSFSYSFSLFQVSFSCPISSYHFASPYFSLRSLFLLFLFFQPLSYFIFPPHHFFSPSLPFFSLSLASNIYPLLFLSSLPIITSLLFQRISSESPSFHSEQMIESGPLPAKQCTNINLRAQIYYHNGIYLQTCMYLYVSASIHYLSVISAGGEIVYP